MVRTLRTELLIGIAPLPAIMIGLGLWAIATFYRLGGDIEVFLFQALGLAPRLGEGHNLMGVLHELRHEHDASCREYKAALKADRRYEPTRQNMLRFYERFAFGASNVPIDLGNAGALD
jgi:lipoprotein NlpI